MMVDLISGLHSGTDVVQTLKNISSFMSIWLHEGTVYWF